MQDARCRYEAALVEAGQISRKAVSSGFDGKREKRLLTFGSVWLDLWMHRERSGSVSSTWHLYKGGGCLPLKNCRTLVEEKGEKTATACAVKVVINHVQRSYSMLGCKDDCHAIGKE